MTWAMLFLSLYSTYPSSLNISCSLLYRWLTV